MFCWLRQIIGTLSTGHLLALRLFGDDMYDITTVSEIPTNSYRKWTEEHVEEFERLWNAGVPIREMCARLGRSRSALVAYAYLHRDRFPARPRGRRRKG